MKQLSPDLKSCTLAHAADLADLFLTRPPVAKVWLFGSLARGEAPSGDIDLLLIVDEDIFDDFASDLSTIAVEGYSGRRTDSYATKRERLAIIRRLLAIDSGPAHRLLDELATRDQVDVFLVFPDWERPQNLLRLQAQIPCADRDFFRHVVTDARRYIAGTGQFLKP